MPDAAVRLFVALRVTMGQIALMSIPVLILIPREWAWLLCLEVLLAIVLSLLWPWLPGNGWVKGALLGTLLGLVCFGARLLQTPLPGALLPLAPLAIALAATWLGGMLMGAKA